MKKLWNKQVRCNKNICGYLTLFLTLTLVSMITIIYILIKGLMQHSVALESQVAADIGRNSILAEYHQQLFEQYGVLFVDLTYGTNLASISNINEKLKANVAKNCLEWNLFWEIIYEDLLNLKVKKAEIIQIQLATDHNAASFRKQAIYYMYERKGLLLFEDLLKWNDEVESFTVSVSELEALQSNLEEKYKSNTEDIAGIIEWSPQLFQNIELTREDKATDLLLYLFEEKTDEVSKNKIDLSQYFSQRVENQGTGINQHINYDETVIDSLVFELYILEKTTNYLEQKDTRVLEYELEYVLQGKDSDYDNFATTVRDIFLIRQASNFTAITFDVLKKEIAMQVSVLIAAVTYTEGLISFYHTVILFLWSFAESVIDVRVLLDEGCIPLMKMSDDWFLDWEALLTLNTYSSFSDQDSSNGLSYQQYLQLLLFFQDDEIITSRFLDIVEMNIRTTDGNQNFRIDTCSDSMQTEITIIGNNLENTFIQWCGYYE